MLGVVKAKSLMKGNWCKFQNILFIQVVQMLGMLGTHKTPKLKGKVTVS